MAWEMCQQETFENRIQDELRRRNSREDINKMMGLRLDFCNAQNQEAVFCHEPEPWEVNIYGTMHGGLISFILDASMAITCRSALGDAVTPTLDIHVNFVKAVKQGRTVYIKAKVVHAGRSIVQMKADLWTDDVNEICASANAIFYRADAVRSGR